MLTIPLRPTPSQTTKAILGGQNCTLNIYQSSGKIYADVTVDTTPVVVGVLCHNLDPIICRQYVGFVGNLLFVDTEGVADPEFSGIGARWQLVYMTEAELVQYGVV